MIRRRKPLRRKGSPSKPRFEPPIVMLSRDPKRREWGIRRVRRGHEGRAECDALWSELVRKRAGGACKRMVICLRKVDGSSPIYHYRCGNRSYLQSHHAVSRARLVTRYDPANGLALCRGCHWWVHHHLRRDDTVAWYASHGIDLPALEARAAVRGYRPDYAAIRVMLRVELEKLG